MTNNITSFHSNIFTMIIRKQILFHKLDMTYNSLINMPVIYQIQSTVRKCEVTIIYIHE